MATIIELDDTNTCKMCENALGKYSCPRCNTLYCSLNCYQSKTHLECSESFYKESILDELLLDKDNHDSKAKIMKILKEANETDTSNVLEEPDDIPDIDSDDDDVLLDITERLAGVDLDDSEAVWSKLTEDEKQEFVAFLKSEDVSKLITAWKPWWLYCDNTKVEEVNVEKNVYGNDCPKLCDINSLKVITKSPADCVKYNMINILASYAFTTRYFNGEHFSFAKEAATCLVTLSLAIKIAQNFEDYDTAVKSVEMECVNSNWIISDSENIQVMREDLTKILKGPKTTDSKFYILCALSDIHHLFSEAMKPKEKDPKDFSKQFPDDHFPSVQLEDLKKIKYHLRKIEYFLCYAKHFFTLID